ncbi:hypothetical protein DM298_03940 [Lactobacillus amylovorus]|uniref:Uncharacterized protein n=1 Tax=Lactobacillus amylovorus TaxID=1604 RepID=A0A5B8ECI2_LACAM|nr:hypothetical protein DM298_03940 [Lactobacillus amylovorus]
MACGLFFSNQLLFWFLVVGTLINIFVVMFASSRLEREYERTNMVHIIKDSLIERYGLMTMIALGEIISSLYDFSKTPINWNRFIQFTLCIILVALLAAVYYQVLGELYIQLNSSIATSLTGWLFLLVILFIFLIDVSLHLVIIDGNLESKILFSFSLILMLLMIRVLFLISIHFKLSKLQIKLSWILLIEMIINLAAAFLPAMG